MGEEFSPVKLQAHLVHANQFSKEFIKFNYNQILKKKKIEQIIESQRQDLNDLLKQLADQSIDDPYQDKDRSKKRSLEKKINYSQSILIKDPSVKHINMKDKIHYEINSSMNILSGATASNKTITTAHKNIGSLGSRQHFKTPSIKFNSRAQINKSMGDIKSQQEEEINEKKELRKQIIKGLIRECRKVESSSKIYKGEFKKEVTTYQSYINNFSKYIEFKAMNPYSEKDPDFERQTTPYLNRRGSSYLDQRDSRAQSIIMKYKRNDTMMAPSHSYHLSLDNNSSKPSQFLLRNLSIDQTLDKNESRNLEQLDQAEGQLSQNMSIQQIHHNNDSTNINTSPLANDISLPILKTKNSKEMIEQLRRNILRKRQQKTRVYHDEMYKDEYWKDNYYKGFKGFQEQISDLRMEYDQDKLDVSCDIIMKAKRLRMKKISIK